MVLSRVILVIVVGLFSATSFSQSGRQSGEERERADTLIQNAAKKFAIGDFKGNVELLKEAATMDPENPRVWWKLCEGYSLTDELTLAVSACQRNVELNPDGISYNSLGLAFLAQHDFAQATQAFEKAIADPKVPPLVYQNLMWAVFGSKQYKKAVAFGRRYVQASVGDNYHLKIAYELMGVAYDKTGQPHQAQEAFKKAHVKSCEIGVHENGDQRLDCHD